MVNSCDFIELEEFIDGIDINVDVGTIGIVFEDNEFSKDDNAIREINI